MNNLSFLFTDPFIRWFLWGIAALYFFGAAAHVSNMLGLGGTPWMSTPVHWRIFDVTFLVLDAAVVIGVIFRQPFAVVAFVSAALLQLVFYTAFTDQFSTNEEQRQTLFGLVIIHAVTLVIFAGLVIRRNLWT